MRAVNAEVNAEVARKSVPLGDGRMLRHGLKDHQIAILVNDVTQALRERFPVLPAMTRAVVSEAVLASLDTQHARADGREGSLPIPLGIPLGPSQRKHLLHLARSERGMVWARGHSPYASLVALGLASRSADAQAPSVVAGDYWVYAITDAGKARALLLAMEGGKNG